MPTKPHIRAAGSFDPEALDNHVAETYPRGVATEEQQPTAPPTRPLGKAGRYPPLCAHGMNSSAQHYDLALARLRRG